MPADGPHLGGKAPAANLAERLAALALLSHAELRAEWRRLYRAHPPQRIGRDVLELGVAWKLQEKALGGTSAATKRRLADLEPIREVWIPDQGFVERRRSMRRIMARRTKAAAFRAWRS